MKKHKKPPRPREAAAQGSSAAPAPASDSAPTHAPAQAPAQAPAEAPHGRRNDTFVPGARRPSELSLLKRTVHALYHDARSHILLEREASLAVAALQKKVEVLQMALHALSDVLVEEVDAMRGRLGQSEADLRLLRAEARSTASELRRELGTLQREWREEVERRAAEARELRDPRTTALQQEVHEWREAAEAARRAGETEARHLRLEQSKLRQTVEALQGEMLVQQRASQSATAELQHQLATLQRQLATLQPQLAPLREQVHALELGRWTSRSAAGPSGGPCGTRIDAARPPSLLAAQAATIAARASTDGASLGAARRWAVARPET